MRKIALALLGATMLTGCVEDTSFVSGNSSDNLNRVMSISNDTGVTIMRFYASNTGRNTWGPDQLGSSVLGSGQSWRVNFDDGTGACHYDFRAEFADGDVLTTSNVNVCVETGWRYH